MRTFIRHNGVLLYPAAGCERIRDVVANLYGARHFGVKQRFDRSTGSWMAFE